VTDGPAFEGPPGDGGLEELREQLRLTREAAERLAADAAGAARSRVPPRGWEVPRDGSGDGPAGGGELQALAALLESIRAALPREITQQLAELVRELMLLLRMLIDWYLERLGARGAEAAPAVEEIPID
jgi:hypothetical protein